jgi:hypothetical protein
MIWRAGCRKVGPEVTGFPPVLRRFLTADTPIEYDPEDDRPRSSDGSDEEDASSEDEKAATEHYVSVGYVISTV